VTHVLILADGIHQEERWIPCSTEQGIMVDAFQRAIAADAALGSSRHIAHLTSPQQLLAISEDTIVCPLTLNVMPDLEFAGQAIYQICQDIAGLRQWVRREWGLLTGEGDLWLPVALTAKGPLYGEVIGAEPANPEAQTEVSVLSYYQPLHLSDRLRQPLYHLAGRLLRLHLAPPAVYLLQFRFEGADICFDRLFPFPAVPAIASIGVQVPNLFMAHWRCITGQPLQDLVIPGSLPHRVLHFP
jgi:hypothetical protein